MRCLECKRKLGFTHLWIINNRRYCLLCASKWVKRQTKVFQDGVDKYLSSDNSGQTGQTGYFNLINPALIKLGQTGQGQCILYTLTLLPLLEGRL